MQSYSQFSLSQADIDKVKMRNFRRKVQEYIATNGSEPSDSVARGFYDATAAELEEYRKILYSQRSNVPAPDYSNGHSYVDLGLSVKWATCNIGAINPEDSGDFFAWGETEPYYTVLDISNIVNNNTVWKPDEILNDVYQDYGWDTYKFTDGFNQYHEASSYTKYNSTDNKTTLDLVDDAARANWGGHWRMPTATEIQELINNTTYSWEQVNGVYGGRFSGNGNSIFIPAVGWFREKDYIITNNNPVGYLWSSTRNPEASSSILYATSMCVYSGGTRCVEDNSRRCYGYTVRGVISL